VKRLEMTIVLGFAIMFVAGVAVGMSGLVGRAHPVDTSNPTPTTKPDDHFPAVGKALDLTSEQKQKMEAIWKDAHSKSEKLHQTMAEDEKARSAEIRKLFTPEQLTAYDELLHSHDATVAKYRAEIRADMDDTHKKIRAILTSEQAVKFDQMAKDHGYRHGPPPMGGPPGEGGFGPPHHHHHNPDTSTSRPETAPSP
jgi:Spy/CpxP family protein refolding chaperone